MSEFEEELRDKLRKEGGREAKGNDGDEEERRDEGSSTHRSTILKEIVSSFRYIFYNNPVKRGSGNVCHGPPTVIKKERDFNPENRTSDSNLMSGH